MMPLHLHVNQKSDYAYNMIRAPILLSKPHILALFLNEFYKFNKT